MRVERVDNSDTDSVLDNLRRSFELVFWPGFGVTTSRGGSDVCSID